MLPQTLYVVPSGAKVAEPLKGGEPIPRHRLFEASSFKEIKVVLVGT